MPDARLNSSVEATALVRRAEADGGFGTILRKGDADRGSILIAIVSRGRHAAVLERTLGMDGSYRWAATGPAESADSQEVAEFLARRARFDDDLWLIELDIAHPERFIAETIAFD